MKKILTYAGTSIGLATMIVLGSGIAASAHECYIPNRSVQGNASATNSQAWFTIVVADMVNAGVGQGYTQNDANCIIDAYDATGAPASFTVKVKGANGQDGTLIANNPNEWLTSDGKGVDHVLDAYGAQIFGAFATCGVSFG